MTIEVALLISIISVAFSIFFGIKNNKRTDASEVEARVAENTRVSTKLDIAVQNTVDIKNDIRNMNSKIETHDKQIVILEQSQKALHHRLDGVEDRLNKGE